MANTIIRIRTDSAGNAVDNLSKIISEGRNAKDKVSSAIYKIKWDDIFSIGHYSKSLYNNLDASKDKLNKLNNKLEALTSSAKDAVNAFADADMGAKTKGKKKKRDWEKIFKELTRYSVKTTIGALLGGVGRYIIANGINDGISSKNNATSSGNSITVIKKEKDKKINSKEIEKKGKEVDENYNSIKEEYEKKVAPNLESKINMGPYSRDQNSYPDFNTGSGGRNEGCACTSYAIARSIITGQPQNPTDFDLDGTSLLSTNQYCDGTYHDLNSSGYGYGDIYGKLKQGLPVLMNFNNGAHYIVVTGVRPDANIDSLGASDFIAVDPFGGKTVQLNQSTMFSENSIRVRYMKNEP